MLECRLGGVLDNLGRAVHRLRDQCGGHRRSDADLGLAAALRAREGRGVLAQVADGRAGEQPPANLLHRHLPLALHEGVHDRRHDTCRTARRCGDDQMTAGIFLGSSEGAGRHQGDRAVALVLVVHRARPDRRRLGVKLDRARQDVFLDGQTGLHRREHRRRDLVQEGVDLLLALPGHRHLVCHDDVRDREVVASPRAAAVPSSSHRDISAAPFLGGS